MIPADSLVGIWLQKLQIWRDHQRFYCNTDWPDLLDQSRFGFFNFADVVGIKSCDESIIIIDNLTESWHSSKRFLQYPKDRKYIIFSGGTWDTDMHHLPFCYKVIFHRWFLLEMADTYLSPQRFCFYSDVSIDFDSEKSFLFVSTIGSHRPIRDLIVDKLTKAFKHDPVLVKYSGECIIGSDTGLDPVAVEPGNFDPYIVLLEQYYHNISQTVPIRLYNSARFNLVVESDVDYCGVFFLTEKTVKCLITGMPFVIISTPHFLKHLRRLGFKTFDSVWDESYDDIQDTNQRIDAVVKLCQDLKKFDWRKHTTELEMISMHNRLQFLRLDKVATSEFQNAYSMMNGDWICPGT